jgi:rubredoxin
MSEKLTQECPECGSEQEFYQAASMEVHIGTKVKWRCSECHHGFVRIDGTVDTATA